MKEKKQKTNPQSRRYGDDPGTRDAQMIWTLCVGLTMALVALYHFSIPRSGGFLNRAIAETTSPAAAAGATLPN